MGAEFLQIKIKESGDGKGGYAKEMSPEFIKAEKKLFYKQCKEVDIIITTAAIPGKKAPLLLEKYMIDVMKKGSVVVDLAAQSGGNCELTELDKVVDYNGVKIVGHSNLTNLLPNQSSSLFSNNVINFMSYLTVDNEFQPDFEDIVVKKSLITKEGRLL